MDDILEVLLITSQEMNTTVSTELIENCYYIEKKFQFELDRSLPLSEMRKAVNTEIESTSIESSCEWSLE
jgi:hypothetical protein